MNIESSKYLNRELSWLDFNRRVLQEAQDESLPLLERLKFIAIFNSNLDEFFMVRVAALRQQIESGGDMTDPSGLTPVVQVDKIEKKVRTLMRDIYTSLDDILEGLSHKGIRILKYSELDVSQEQQMKIWFRKNILPVLTPVAVDLSHPFPILTNNAIEILLEFTTPRSGKSLKAFVEVPSVLPRFIRVQPGKTREQSCWLLLEELIVANLGELFNNCEIISAFPFKLTRDMDFSLDEEITADLLSHIENQLRKRKRRAPVRLEIPFDANRRLRRWLVKHLQVPGSSIFPTPGPLRTNDFFELIGKESERSDLLEPKWPQLEVPELPPTCDVFAEIRRRKSIMLMHPFHTFEPVVRFLESAAEDPDVLAIKQTLYRVSGKSPVVNALQQAAENGKQVTVIVELKARFDEENNIAWARQLEESGAHVIYGIAGLKIHSKALLIIRREEGRIKRYAHLGTGNYNDKTASLYTDTGIFTTDEDICSDAAAMFNCITGYSQPPSWNKLAVSPFNIRERFQFLIDREARLSTPNNPGYILAKMNSLCDPEIIDHLYAAAEKGVKIDLIIRGICTLRPLNPNIRVVSILDRFLEHSRIYFFQNAGRPEYYLASADWMPRNLNRRIELLFPVEDEDSRSVLKDILKLQLNDSWKGRTLYKNGVYRYNRIRNPETRSQELTYNYFKSRSKPKN